MVVDLLLYGTYPGQTIANPRTFAATLLYRPERAGLVQHIVIEPNPNAAPRPSRYLFFISSQGHNRKRLARLTRRDWEDAEQELASEHPYAGNLFHVMLPRFVDVIAAALPDSYLYIAMVDQLHRGHPDAVVSMLFLLCWNVKSINLTCGKYFEESLSAQVINTAPLCYEAYQSLERIHVRGMLNGFHYTTETDKPLRSIHRLLSMPNVKHLTTTGVSRRGIPTPFPDAVNTDNNIEVYGKQWVAEPSKALQNLENVHVRAVRYRMDLRPFDTFLDSCRDAFLKITPFADGELDYEGFSRVAEKKLGSALKSFKILEVLTTGRVERTRG